MTASRDDLRAWQYGETMYIRTALTLISPGWRSTISSSDGMMHAYEIEPTGIILVLDQGKLTKVTLKGL